MTVLHQFVPVFAAGDAIGNHVLQIRATLRAAGYESEIFADAIHPSMRRRARHYLDFRAPAGGPSGRRGSVHLLYHLSTGNRMAAWLAGQRLPLAVDYHNITPAEYFDHWQPATAQVAREARAELRRLASAVAWGLADSGYNAAELIEEGYPDTAVVPILLDFATYDAAPAAATLTRLRRRAEGGGAEWLFVGRVAANKCQHDLIAAFAVYRQLFDPRARLSIVGGRGLLLYARALERLVGELGVADAVEFTDAVKFPQLLAHYRAADVFVSLSEHEGFCVPLVEAMHFGVPTVAYACCRGPRDGGRRQPAAHRQGPAGGGRGRRSGPHRRHAPQGAGRGRPPAGGALLAGQQPAPPPRRPRTEARREYPPRAVSALHQFLPFLAAGDAIGNHALRLQQLLRESGYDSEIFVEDAQAAMRERCRPYQELQAGPSDCLLYHLSTGSPLAGFLAEQDHRLAVYYHNITPARFFDFWEPQAAANSLRAREEMRKLAPVTRFAMANSTYSEAELRAEGYADTSVVPVLVDFTAYDHPEDRAAAARLGAAGRGGGGAHWLFVGRLAPNKCQHDVIGAFAAYQAIYDPGARLSLIGGRTSPLYHRALQRLVAELGLGGAVDLADVVTFPALLAYYRAADVFVSLSKHEGFLVPALEAMHFGVPVVARGATAVPETVGDAGLLLPDDAAGDPAVVAAAVHRVLTDEPLRDRLVAAGHGRVEHFSAPGVSRRFLEVVRAHG